MPCRRNCPAVHSPEVRDRGRCLAARDRGRRIRDHPPPQLRRVCPRDPRRSARDRRTYPQDPAPRFRTGDLYSSALDVGSSRGSGSTAAASPAVKATPHADDHGAPYYTMDQIVQLAAERRRVCDWTNAPELRPSISTQDRRGSSNAAGADHDGDRIQRRSSRTALSPPPSAGKSDAP